MPENPYGLPDLIPAVATAAAWVVFVIAYYDVGERVFAWAAAGFGIDPPPSRAYDAPPRLVDQLAYGLVETIVLALWPLVLVLVGLGRLFAAIEGPEPEN